MSSCIREFEVAECMGCVKYHKCIQNAKIASFYIPVSRHKDFRHGHKIPIFRTGNKWRIKITVCQDHVKIASGFVTLIKARQPVICPSCNEPVRWDVCGKCGWDGDE